ncbi:MAG: hypothetical protein R3B93_12125 [Bacteroidia bacterium]
MECIYRYFVGVTGYNVYVNGSNIGSVTGTSANITGLSAVQHTHVCNCL